MPIVAFCIYVGASIQSGLVASGKHNGVRDFLPYPKYII